MKKEFTSGQKEIIARKLGYEGPMQGFEAFLASSPALSAKYNMVTDKYVQRMAKGGLTSQRKVKKYAVGGDAGAAARQAETDAYLANLKASLPPPPPSVSLGGSAKPAAPAPSPASTLTAKSTPAEIASAYNAVIANAGGDTEANRKTAVEYLRNLGVPDTVTTEAYKIATTPATPAPAPAPAAKAAQTAPTPSKAELEATVRGAYQTSLGRTPEQSEVDYWVGLKNQGLSDQEIVNAFNNAAKEEIAGRTAAPSKAELEAIVVNAYKTGLNRTPEQSEVDYWVGLKEQGLSDQEIVNAFNNAAQEELANRPTKTQAEIDLENRITELEAKVTAATDAAAKAAAQAELNAAKSAQAELTSRTTIGEFGKPVRGTSPTMTAAQIAATGEQDIGTEGLAPTTAGQATPTQAGAAQTAAAPTPLTAAQMQASTAADSLRAALAGLAPATGAVTQQVTAAEQAPTTTAVGGVEAATGQAQQVVAPAARTAQAGEMISGTGVDMAQAEALAAQTAASAAQGVVTEEMTVQGQLNKVLADFDAGNPPPWAAATMRSAVAQMAARGLNASSMAGQAIVQAAMEAAVPIAAADAKVFEQMGLQNLSNRQQTAVLAAQQRAAFLGQEFDQAFQMRVANAAKVADIANMNFTANQQIALENARLAQNMDLANLSNQQAVVMAEAAQIATLETTNLNNRQQAQVVNAQNFLQMDLANMSNEQQTTLFKAQQITNALLSDTAAENAAKQFNATSQNQTDQFMASLTSQVNQFNAAQRNALEQFNVDQANAIERFNTEAQNARDQFNSTQRLVIDQSNAQWRREISTANTAATNSANYLNAQILQAMTLAEYNNEIVLYRDQIQQAFDAFQNSEERAAAILTATITGNSAKAAAAEKSNGDLAVELGKWALSKWG